MSPGAKAMGYARPLTLCLWLLLVVSAVLIVVRARYVADLSAFLPRAPSPAQQLLVQQLQDGPASRLLLVGIEGGDAATRAVTARALSVALRPRREFLSVSDGEDSASEADQRFVFEHRYLLSPAVTPQRFSVEGLHSAIGESLELLASPAGLSAKALFTADPTGETLQVLDQLQTGATAAHRYGVWSSADGQRALLLLQTAANGSDTDAQQRALQTVASAWVGLHTSGLRLLLSSPGKFAVESRATIQREAVRLSLLSSALIVTLLACVYRSLLTLLLGLLPVVCGALAGIASVALGFPVVHGITLGFGVTLIGESVDYSVYLLVQSRGGQTDLRHGALWPTMLLGVLTSICGFASLLPSAFPGLSQLGLFSIAGLAAAALVTRFVLPLLLPPRLAMADLNPLGATAARWGARLHLPAALAIAVSVGCSVVLWHARDRLWNRDIAALSPIPPAAQRLDLRLRADLGAPDIGSLIVIDAPDEQSALDASEAVGTQLDALISQHVMAGYDSPARYLPSARAQQQRRDSLPGSADLRARLTQVSAQLGIQQPALEPFLQQVEATRSGPLLTRASLQGTSFAFGLDALLWQHDGSWHALLPLHAILEGPDAGEVDLTRVRATLPPSARARFQVINVKQQTDALYDNYLAEATHLSLLGFVAILLLLWIALRAPQRVMRVLAPLVLAVLCVASLLALTQVHLTLLHLIGMLLIVAVGSNYALFFDRCAAGRRPAELPLTLASLLIANLCTVIGFGVLAFSTVPVLNALGTTVAPGTLLALGFSAALAPRELWS
jgi:predicted exporter